MSPHTLASNVPTQLDFLHPSICFAAVFLLLFVWVIAGALAYAEQKLNASDALLHFALPGLIAAAIFVPTFIVHQQEVAVHRAQVVKWARDVYGVTDGAEQINAQQPSLVIARGSAASVILDWAGDAPVLLTDVREGRELKHVRGK